MTARLDTMKQTAGGSSRVIDVPTGANTPLDLTDDFADAHDPKIIWVAANATEGLETGSGQRGRRASSEVTFDSRPLRAKRTVMMLVTAYSPDERSCGKWADGFTASGYSVKTNAMKLVAADTDLLPFGSVVSVPGYNNGRPVPVLDRGGGIKGLHLDLLFPTHEEARHWGKQRLPVTIWEYAD